MNSSVFPASAQQVELAEDDLRKLAPDIVEQAIHWKVSLLPLPDDSTLWQEFTAWLQRSPDHMLAWQRIERMCGDISNSIGKTGRQAALVALEESAQGLRRRRALKLLSLLFAATSTASLGYRASPLSADFRTATGERRSMTLPDGSRLTLNTHSAVDLHFSSDERLLVLREGELLLESGADAGAPLQRPLRVRAEQALFEAIGTRFLVRQDDAMCRLLVEEGRVAITSLGGEQLIAEAGETFSVGTNIIRERGASLQLGGWLRGALVVEGITLGEFLAELSRYRSGYLGCAEDVANLRLSGVFQLDDSDALLSLLPELLPVRVVTRSRWWARVMPA